MTVNSIECTTKLPNQSFIASKQWNVNQSNTQYAICVHGWLDNANSYDPLMNYIADKLSHITFIAVDLPGHGKSTHTNRYDIMSDSAALYNFIDVLLNERKKHNDGTMKHIKLHLIAHSWGGTVAQIAAAISPDRIQSIILLDSLGPFTAEPCDIPASFSTAVINRAKRISKSKKQYNTLDDIVSHYMSGNKYIGRASTELLMQRGACKLDNNKYIFVHDVQLQQWYMSLTEPVYIAFLGRLQCHVTHILAQNEERLR